jgi:putative ABC transport system permease protein
VLTTVLRGLVRQKSALSLITMEVAFGFVVLCHLLVIGDWYFSKARGGAGEDPTSMLHVNVVSPVAPTPGATAAATGAGRREEDAAALRALPGVRHVLALSADLLDERRLFPAAISDRAIPTGAGATDAREPRFAWSVWTGPNLVEALGLTLLEGAPFPSGGVGPTRGAGPEAAPGAVIVSRCVRDDLFPGRSAVGRTLHSSDAPPARIVGVIENITLKVPFLPRVGCLVLHLGDSGDEREDRYLVRVEAGRIAEVQARADALLRERHAAAVVKVRPYDRKQTRFSGIAHGLVIIIMVIAAQIGIVALVGSFAVSSFLVAQRVRQIGIRRALGATRFQILADFLLENAVATGVGNAIGLVLTLAVSSRLDEAFPGITLKPAFLAVSAALMWITGLVATWGPARRGAGIPPIVASRCL